MGCHTRDLGLYIPMLNIGKTRYLPCIGCHRFFSFSNYWAACGARQVIISFFGLPYRKTNAGGREGGGGGDRGSGTKKRCSHNLFFFLISDDFSLHEYFLYQQHASEKS